MNILAELTEKKLAHPPDFLVPNLHYLTMMGSIAYGVSSDVSDLDLYGMAIPLKTMVFPHLNGEIEGFGTQKQRFEQYQEHHIYDPQAKGGNGQSVDVAVYSIVKYFQLLMDNNPNIIDSLFTPANSVLHITHIGQMVKDNRKLFLHKGSFQKFKGYAYSQLHKMDNKNPEGKRKELVERWGYDVKFAYHLLRLLDEAEQILTEGDLDLMRNREQLKSVRRGEWKEEDIRKYFAEKEKALETVYLNSKLPWGPDENKIKQLLLQCLEAHYGSLDKCIVNMDKYAQAVKDIKRIIERVE